MRHRKVLFVDDEPMIVKIMSKRLQVNHFDVVSVSSGGEALKKAKSDKPDIILLDIKMPDMDGYEVCRELKKDGKTKDIPVIMFSASQEDGFQAKARDVGAVTVVNKPFVAELLDEIKRVFGDLPVEDDDAA